MKLTYSTGNFAERDRNMLKSLMQTIRRSLPAETAWLDDPNAAELVFVDVGIDGGREMFDEIARYLRWANGRYGLTVIFALLEADFIGMSHEPEAALQLLTAVGELPEVASFPALAAGVKLAQRKFLHLVKEQRYQPDYLLRIANLVLESVTKDIDDVMAPQPTVVKSGHAAPSIDKVLEPSLAEIEK